MKYTVLTILLLVLTSITLTSLKTDDPRKDLLCHKWIQVAFKANADKSPHTVTIDLAKTCKFKQNGSYEEAVDNDGYKAEGNWFFNPGETKMEFTFSNMNGLKIPPLPETTRDYNIIILKLTKDSLIYGQEDYNGKDKIYGHDDWYFVRD